MRWTPGLLAKVIVFPVGVLALAGVIVIRDRAREPLPVPTITPGMTLGDGAARQFELAELEVGDQFPSVDVFDAEGSPINTSSLKGQYTVLVSGCLT